jgi:RHS repeat-associated protein
MSYPSGSTNWRYDARGRVLDKTQLVASFSQSVAYGYDTAGRLSFLRYPSGRTLSYSWDGDQLTAIALDGTTLLDTIEYFPFGTVKGWRFANGQSYQRSLDGEGRISAYTLGPTQWRSLGYDLASRIRSFNYLPVSPLLDEAFDYDGLDRLVTATVNATSRGYAYDANGNRSELMVNGVSYPYTVSPTSNRLNATATAQGGLRNFTYDAAGLMSGDGRIVFTHDARARLIKATVGTAVTSYLIDAKGQRIRKSGGPAGTVYFVFDEAGHLLGEYNSAGSPLQEFVWIGDTPVAILTGAGTLFDNSTATSVVIAGTWTAATSPKGYQGANFHLHAAGGAGESFTWKINPPTTGSYRLYARWSAEANRAPDASYTVSHAGGSTLFTADQRAGGGQWVELGTFNFTRNAGHTVRLDASANGTVSADAMKLVPTTAATYYVHPDHLNAPRVVTDTQNAIRWRWLAEPFGGTGPEENPSNLVALTVNLRFPGQYYDVETGLSYNFFRDYDAQTGRYVQADPIGLAGGSMSLYTYADNAPTMKTDLLGLFAEMCYRPIQGYIIPGQHCFARFNGDDNNTSSFTLNGVGPDASPKGATCEKAKGPDDDDCVKREMKKCQNYHFFQNDCCHCVEQALKACGQSIPPKQWPNWPINPGPQPGEPGYKP